jgi:hypothetical protein
MISQFASDYGSCLMAVIKDGLSQAKNMESEEYWKGALTRRVAHPTCRKCHEGFIDNIYLAELGNK